MDIAMNSMDRVKLVMKEWNIATVVQRLQTQKGVDLYNVDDSERMGLRPLWTLEADSKAQQHTMRSSTHVEDDDDDDDEASTITPVAATREQNQHDPQKNAYGLAFDEDLQNSSIHKRTLYRNSGKFLVSSAAGTTASSVLSAPNLANVSVISVSVRPV
ncbi:MAG: hypothetical protein M1835_002077 [Candelina submexicana]|nr:MAG: hypothetical protein M1835_002077 [Candelina submexicana]